MDNISNWTERNLMQLNEKKSKIMVINFTTNYQFATRISLNGSVLDTIQETKLLGTIFSSDMKWHKNSQLLTQKGYQRMSILRNLFQFDIHRDDLVLIYTMYIRSIMEFNSNVWFSSITLEERENIDRVQRVACKIILKDEYVNYQDALVQLNLESLSNRRQLLAKRFAIKSVKNEKFSDLFPTNENNAQTRNNEKYKVKFAKTGRLQNSSIPAMQKLLNRDK